MTWTCSKCGEDNSDGQTWCGGCGVIQARRRVGDSPCPCCAHYDDGHGESACLGCKHNAADNFMAGGKCATCRYDPRTYGICKRCVDFDQWAERTTT